MVIVMLFHYILLALLTAQSPLSKPNPAATYHRDPKPQPEEAVTQDWPCLLGATHNGISRETKLLKQFSDEQPHLVWEMKTGRGYSAPSIVGNKLVYIHRIDDREVIECLQATTGKRYWKHDYPTNYRDRYGYNDGPRASPVIDESRVYTLGAEGKLYCFNLENGKEIWDRDLFAEFGLTQDFFGVSSTPLVEGDLLIVNLGASGGPCVIALDKRNGATIWQTGNEWGSSYASPIPAQIHGQRRVLVFAGGESRPPTGGLLCIDPTNGQINFRFRWRSKKYESVNAACPVVADDRVFVSASYETGGALVRVKADFTHEELWTTQKLGTHFGTSIVQNGFLYGFDGRHRENAALVCMNMQTGEEVWRFVPQWIEKYQLYSREQEKSYGTYRASLVLVDGQFLCLGEFGHLLWLDLSPKGHRILARTWLFAAVDTWTAPVIRGGLLYVTQNSRDFISGQPPRLLCYDLRGHPDKGDANPDSGP